MSWLGTFIEGEVDVKNEVKKVFTWKNKDIVKNKLLSAVCY